MQTFWPNIFFKKLNTPGIALGLFFLWFSVVNESFAQQIDTIRVKNIEVDYSLLPKNPKKATFLSALVPGFGQIYNGKSWKVPIIYGAFLTDLYFVQYNNRRYTVFINSLNSFDKGQKTDFPSLNRVALVRNVDFWRRNRDLTILFLGVIYALNIIDANVDAHLSGFEISEDLALKIKPHFESFSAHQNTVGITLQLKYKP